MDMSNGERKMSSWKRKVSRRKRRGTVGRE